MTLWIFNSILLFIKRKHVAGLFYSKMSYQVWFVHRKLTGKPHSPTSKSKRIGLRRHLSLTWVSRSATYCQQSPFKIPLHCLLYIFNNKFLFIIKLIELMLKLPYISETCTNMLVEITWYKKIVWACVLLNKLIYL